MAIAVVYRPPAVSAEQYKASWADGSPMPDPEGLLFHAGVGEDDDFFTVSVWESREAYDAFASRFKEALGAEGFQGGAPKILPVHHPRDHGLPAWPQTEVDVFSMGRAASRTPGRRNATWPTAERKPSRTSR